MRNVQLIIEKIVLFIAASFILVFFVSHFLYLSLTPSGLYVDESSIGYNAFSILRTGRDEHGHFLPLYFEAFGDYKNPIYVYSVTIPFLLFGVSVTSLRLTSTIWILAAILSLIFFLLKLKETKKVIIFTLLLLLTNPWQWELSRVAYELSSTPFFLIVAICSYYLCCKVTTQKEFFKWFVLFALSLGFSFYTYTSARVLAVLFFICGIFFLRKKITLTTFFTSTGIFIVCLLPLFISQSLQEGALLARYKVVGLSYYTNSNQEFFLTAAKNYFSHFSPAFLFFGGDENLSHVPVPYGILLLSSAYFLVVGLVYGYKKESRDFFWWLISCLVISPIPSAVTIQSPHVLRVIGWLPFIFILFWWGIRFTYQTKENIRILSYAFFFLLFFESFNLFQYISTAYISASRPWFEAGTVDAIQTALQFEEPHYFSIHLYPGTYATIYFFEIIHFGYHSEGNLHNIFFFDSELQAPYQRGIYVVETPICYSYLNTDSDLSLIQVSDGTCVLKKD